MFGRTGAGTSIYPQNSHMISFETDPPDQSE